MKRAIIHIGTEKTGTTTLQELLSINRERLARHGYAYLRSPGVSNHRKLPSYCLPENVLDDHTSQLRLENPEARRAWKAGFRAELFKELDALAPDIHTVVVSSEHLHSRLQSPASIEALRELLSGHCASFNIVVYLRRQDRVARSLHSTAIRNGHSWLNRLPAARRDQHYYDYDALLSKWSSVFGADSLTPRIFQRDALAGGDLLRDFLEVCGLGSHYSDFAVPPRQNEALSAHTTHIVDIFNRIRKEQKETSPALDRLREKLIAELETAHPGEPWMPTRDEAKRFAGTYAESNAALGEKWFSGSPFDDDFSEYPETQSTPEISWSETAEMFSRAIVACAGTNLILDREQVERRLSAPRQEADALRELSLMLDKGCPRAAFNLIGMARKQRPDGPLIQQQWERLRRIVEAARPPAQETEGQ